LLSQRWSCSHHAYFYAKMDRPTIKQLANFDPSTDALHLRKAMKGLGTDEDSIINVLCNRTSAQRQCIIQCYQEFYHKDLIEDLKSELGGAFERMVLACMKPTSELLAEELHHAMLVMGGIGTNENILVEILCTRSNKDIAEMVATYQKLYKKHLQEDLSEETSGFFRRLLISMSTGTRDEAGTDTSIAPQLAQQLYKAGEDKLGTDESEFNRILASNNPVVLRATFEEYHKIKGKTLHDAIKSEFSGDIQNGLLAVALIIENRPKFFADRLNEAISGMGTRDRDLIRLVVTRSEVDLGDIKDEYQRCYGKTLESAIKGDTSGDYKKMLLSLCAE